MRSGRRGASRRERELAGGRDGRREAARTREEGKRGEKTKEENGQNAKGGGDGDISAMWQGKREEVGKRQRGGRLRPPLPDSVRWDLAAAGAASDEERRARGGLGKRAALRKGRNIHVAEQGRWVGRRDEGKERRPGGGALCGRGYERTLETRKSEKGRRGGVKRRARGHNRRRFAARACRIGGLARRTLSLPATESVNGEASTGRQRATSLGTREIRGRGRNEGVRSRSCRGRRAERGGTW